jgi:hypothetical protein
LTFGLLGCGGLAVLGVALFVVLLIGIGIGGSGKQSSGEPSSTSGAKKSEPKKNADPGNVEAAVGETAELRDRTLVVNEVERNYFPSNRFSRVEPGNELVRVYVTLKNTGGQPFNYNLNDFEVQDSGGVQKTPRRSRSYQTGSSSGTSPAAERWRATWCSRYPRATAG